MREDELRVLHALLLLPLGKLTKLEWEAFRGMYDALMNRRISKLSMRQRAWAGKAYDDHRLGEEQPRQPPPKAKRKAKNAGPQTLPQPPAASVPHALDRAWANRPLKPPGRK